MVAQPAETVDHERLESLMRPQAEQADVIAQAGVFLLRVLEHMHKVWTERRDEVLKGADEISAHLQKVLAPELQPGEPTAAMLDAFLPQSRERYDPDAGGFAQDHSIRSTLAG